MPLPIGGVGSPTMGGALLLAAARRDVVREQVPAVASGGPAAWSTVYADDESGWRLFRPTAPDAWEQP